MLRDIVKKISNNHSILYWSKSLVMATAETGGVSVHCSKGILPVFQIASGVTAVHLQQRHVDHSW